MVGRVLAAKRRQQPVPQTAVAGSRLMAGERINVSVRAIYDIEHERSGGAEEIEFQVKQEPE
jgi:hypothetical protein